MENEKKDTRGVILFNRGEKCIVRAIIALYSLRQHWNGPITFYLEKPYPVEFDETCKFFGVDVVHNEEKHELKTLVRKTDMFGDPPYDRTLWIDSDTVTVGKIDEMFDLLDDADCVIPWFCGWFSDGKIITKRVNRFKGIAEERHLEKCAKHYPAVNTGVLSFKKSQKWMDFVSCWVKLADAASQQKVFIPDEVAMQILYPSADEWGLKIDVCSSNYNVSVLHDHGKSKDPKIWHYHGQKHVLDVPTCDLWKNLFAELMEKNVANIQFFAKNFADKRLKKFMNGERVHSKYAKDDLKDGETKDVTIVTACDEKYVGYLELTFPNWRKYKNIDSHPVIVFVHGIKTEDKRLDFLKLPNVKIVEWDMPEIESHREKMLNAFVFGTAEHVTTDYWLKLDADSYATDYRPLYDESMKEYAFCGHKWSYSKPDHIRALDEWAKTHWKRKLKTAKPMINEGKIEGSRFYHNVKRTISFIQLHKSKFTRFCVSLLKEKRLPAPTQDTFMFFVCNRFDPHLAGTRNFKKDYGFSQGNSRLGVEALIARLEEVEKANIGVNPKEPEDLEEIDLDEVDIETSVKSVPPIPQQSFKVVYDKIPISKNSFKQGV